MSDKEKKRNEDDGKEEVSTNAIATLTLHKLRITQMNDRNELIFVRYKSMKFFFETTMIEFISKEENGC